MSNVPTVCLASPPLRFSRSPEPVVHYGLRRHAPLFGQDRFESKASRTPSSERSRLSVDDRPNDTLSPEAYRRSADLLSSLDRQPTGQACQRRAAQYKAMSLPQVERAVGAALQNRTLSLRHLARVACCLWHGVGASDETIIAIRELCRRGKDPATLGYRAGAAA